MKLTSTDTEKLEGVCDEIEDIASSPKPAERRRR